MKSLDCRLCGALVTNVSDEAVSVTCWDCISEALRAEAGPRKQTRSAAEGYPKGWRFMKEFVHANGTVYHKGVEQPDLKGTLEATQIIAKPKKTKIQKAEEKAALLVEYNDLKKQLKKETRKTVIKRLQSRLKKLQKQI